MDLNEVLGRACDLGASDVHLKIGQPPMVRIDGRIERLPGAPSLDAPDLDQAVATVTATIPERRSIFERLKAAPVALRWAAGYAVIFGLLLLGRWQAREFIYMQF